MNKSLSMVVDSDRQYFELGSDIPLMIENKSSQFISFDVKSHIRILRSNGSHWIEVKNAITYSGAILLSPQSEPLLNPQYTDVEPILDEGSFNDNNTPIPLRIVIIGEVMNGDPLTGEKVGAYVDVALKPTAEMAQPTEPVIYSTAEIMNTNGGTIEGIITSADQAGKPLPNVMVDLKYHPFFNQNAQTKAIATTKTDSQGRYAFENVEPGIYTLNTTLFLEQGGSCGTFDLTKIIKIEAGVVATLNLRLTCTP